MKFISYKNPHYFHFWCQKVLPLVYDNSLSYYEVLCKVVKYLNDLIEDSDAMKANIEELKKAFEELKFYVDNYFDNLDIQDEVNNYFETIKESGELEAIIASAIKGGTVDTSYYAPFAQVLSSSERLFDTGLFAQGFAIGEYNGRPVALTCFTDGTPAGENDVFSLDYLDSGANINKNVIPAGHCNSATFNKTTGTFFVVTGGVAGAPNKILEYELPDGTIKSEHTIEAGPWAIAWNLDKFYIACSGGRLIVTDNDFRLLSNHNMTIDNNYTWQGMEADDLYLYFPNGNNRTSRPDDKPARNRFSVFTHEGELVKNIENMIPIECEEVAIYNNKCYVNCNTQSASLIFIADLYKENAAGYIGLPDIRNINSYTQSIYINETYSGFFCTGSENYPLSSLYWWYMVVKPNVSRVNLELLSDAPEKVFAMWTSCNFYVQLDAHGHKIRRVNWYGNNTIALKDVVIIGQENSISCHITATRFVASGLVFGEENSSIIPSRLLEVIGAPIELISTTINQRSGVTWYLIGSGYLRSITVNVADLDGIFLGGVFDVDSTFPLKKVQNSSVYGMSYKVVVYLTQDINVKDLYFPMLLNITAGSHTISGLPDGVSSADIIAIDVEGLAVHKSVVHIYTRSGEDYTVFNLSA